MTLRVENPGDRPLDLCLRGRTITFDVVVTGLGGDVVWRRLHGKIIPAILRLETLAPREVLELPATWDQRRNDGDLVLVGAYLVRATLLTDTEPPLETPIVELRILSPG